MLAYVFWHAPRCDVDPAAYAAALEAFHAALAADRPSGLGASFTTKTLRLPWLDADPAYEDWYLMADSAALDPLDAAAVDARRRAAHDSAARAARTGTGGLYRLVRGHPIVPSCAVWFGKPDGTKYGAFAPYLDALAALGATVWQRQMSLGPATEFVAHTRSGIDFEVLAGAVQRVHSRLAAEGIS